MYPDFNRLKIFYHIHRNRSVNAAANALSITQSAVSQQLKKLETELQVQLFTRLHRRLVPTPAADMLFHIMCPFMDRLARGIQDMRIPHERPYGLVRIGAPAEFGKRYLPEICAAFRRVHPDVSFHLKLGHPDLLLPLLSKGDIDFAFADIFARRGEFSRTLSVYSIAPLVDETLILACSKEYDGAHLRGDHSFDRLMEADYISYQDGQPALRNWFRHHYRKSSVQLNVALTVENVEGVIQGIKCHMGLAVIPSHLVQGEVGRGDLVHVRKLKREIVNKISLVQLLDKVPSVTEKTFIKHFSNVLHSKGMLSRGTPSGK